MSQFDHRRSFKSISSDKIKLAPGAMHLPLGRHFNCSMGNVFKQFARRISFNFHDRRLRPRPWRAMVLKEFWRFRLGWIAVLQKQQILLPVVVVGACKLMPPGNR
jgi:hypothetical protein